MRFSKWLWLWSLAVAAGFAQKPLTVSGLTGNYTDYWTLSTGQNGDTYYFASYASNAMLPLFPDPTGLPVVGTINDGTSGATCNSGGGGNINLLQLSKLPVSSTTTPTAGNTQITPYPNCLTSFGVASGTQDAPAGWSGACTGGAGNQNCTWKGAVLAFRNNVLFGYPYRQTSPGDRFGDSTLVLSPDAGQTWIDWSRYNAYAIAGATCSNSVVTLTAANALAGNEKIYIHGVTPAGYNGKQTVTAANAGTVTFTLKDKFGVTQTCPGAYSSGGNFGVLDAAGSAPLYDAASANMMWPITGGANKMAIPSPIVYGQDGNYPTGIESSVDPNSYLCGISSDPVSSTTVRPVYLWCVPLGQEMTRGSYRYYYCPSYNIKWPVAETTCDATNPAGAAWTTTQANATPIMYVQNSGISPGERYVLTYVPSHQAYLLSGLTRDPSGTRYSYLWAPHPWGPYYPGYLSDCTEGQGGAHVCGPGFNTAMAYGYQSISVNPPIAQMRISSDEGLGSRPPGGAPSFWGLQAETGRAPFTGMARRADYLGALGQQLGMGHRFASSNMAGTISRRGLALGGGAYALDWWVDFWDHGGVTVNPNRPYFRDVISGGSKYFQARWYDAQEGYTFGRGLGLQTNGVSLSTGYQARMEGTGWSDSTLAGNGSWTIVALFNITSPSGTGVQNQFARGIPVFSTDSSAANTTVEVMVGRRTPGDLCVEYGGTNTTSTSFCTSSAAISANTWYFVAISAQANGTGYPTITMHVGSAGTVTEYGGVNMATSASGATGGGLTKTCTSCATTPAVGSNQVELGWDGTTGESLNGILGEAGLYSGAVPGNAIREIYRTLRTDWARVGRGSI